MLLLATNAAEGLNDGIVAAAVKGSYPKHATGWGLLRQFERYGLKLARNRC